MVRAWLLSNPVLDDPLDLLIYCYRVHRESREPTPPLRGYNYLGSGPVTNKEAIALALLRSGLQQWEAREPEARAYPKLANQAGELQGGDDPEAVLAPLCRALTDDSGT